MQTAHDRTPSIAEMRLVVLLFLATVLNPPLLSDALDDDEGEDSQQYAVTFFQFQPKDLPILGGHKSQFKRDIKRSAGEAPIKGQNKTNVDTSNATASLTLNETTVSSANKTSPVNETSSLQKSSTSGLKENRTVAGPAGPTSDVNIMNALINLAVQKTNKTGNANDTVQTNNATAVSPTNVEVNDTTSIANRTNPIDSAVKLSHGMSSTKRDKVLNPNPKPSEQEAALNVKPPKQLENKEHDNLIHSENTTKVDVSEDKHETITESVEMVKNPNPPQDPSPDNTNATVQNATTLPAVPEGPSAEDEQAKKIAKDKQTNKGILDAAKEITPVKNNVENPTNEVKDIMTETAPKTGSARNNVHHEKKVDEKTLIHRKKLAEFVPLYHKTTPKDHRLSFQVGSLKHPKHNIHPKCHACPLNSTYKECVRKSTLKECSEGLNNICFTKSTKKNGIITYEMGCSDHNNCVHAKAFPCKDGKDHCFTCCQFDRCNSSPHHGDYELDELNLSELTDVATTASLTDETIGLDTKSGAPPNTCSLMALVSTIVVFLFLPL